MHGWYVKSRANSDKGNVSVDFCCRIREQTNVFFLRGREKWIDRRLYR